MRRPILSQSKGVSSLPASVALALALAAGPLVGCSPARVAMSEQGADAAVAMRITDPGQIFSTYDLRNDPEAEREVRSQGVTDAQWQDIVRLSNEAEWPAGLQDLSGRTRLRADIRRLTASRVAAFRDKVILFVPASQPGLPGDIQGRDFYIVVAEAAVTVTGR